MNYSLCGWILSLLVAVSVLKVEFEDGGSKTLSCIMQCSSEVDIYHLQAALTRRGMQMGVSYIFWRRYSSLEKHQTFSKKFLSSFLMCNISAQRGNLIMMAEQWILTSLRGPLRMAKVLSSSLLECSHSLNQLVKRLLLLRFPQLQWFELARKTPNNKCRAPGRGRLPGKHLTWKKKGWHSVCLHVQG